MDDEFNGSSLDVKWTWVNQGGATATLSSKGALVLEAPASASRNIRAIYQTMPSGDFTVTARIRLNVMLAATGEHVGLAVKNSGGNQLLVWSFNFDSFLRAYVQRLSDVNTFSATLGSAAGFSQADFRIYLRVKRVGSLLTFSYSWDGIDFWDYTTETETTFLPGVVNRVGLFADSQSSTIVRNTCEWFRVTQP